MSSADFDIAFITPVMIYGAQDQSERMSARDRGRAGRGIDPGPARRQSAAGLRQLVGLRRGYSAGAARSCDA